MQKGYVFQILLQKIIFKPLFWAGGTKYKTMPKQYTATDELGNLQRNMFKVTAVACMLIQFFFFFSLHKKYKKINKNSAKIAIFLFEIFFLYVGYKAAYDFEYEAQEYGNEDYDINYNDAANYYYGNQDYCNAHTHILYSFFLCLCEGIFLFFFFRNIANMFFSDVFCDANCGLCFIKKI